MEEAEQTGYDVAFAYRGEPFGLATLSEATSADDALHHFRKVAKDEGIVLPTESFKQVIRIIGVHPIGATHRVKCDNCGALMRVGTALAYSDDDWFCADCREGGANEAV